MIAIDLGCATYAKYPEDESVNKLIERFHPEHLYGFDPHPSVITTEIFEKGCHVHLSPTAAWVYDGFIGYSYGWNPLRAETGEMMGPAAVPCFDLADWMTKTCKGAGDVVMKMDVEGAEFTLVPHLIANEIDKWLTLLLVEWHGTAIEGLRCPIEEW